MCESDGAASRRNGRASPLPVGEWVLVAEGAVEPDAKTTLAACGRRHPWAARPRRLMTKMLLMPTRQRHHPVLRVVLMRADDTLRHVEHGSRRLTRHDHRDVCGCPERGPRVGPSRRRASLHDRRAAYRRRFACQPLERRHVRTRCGRMPRARVAIMAPIGTMFWCTNPSVRCLVEVDER